MKPTKKTKKKKLVTRNDNKKDATKTKDGVVTANINDILLLDRFGKILEEEDKEK